MLLLFLWNVDENDRRRKKKEAELMMMIFNSKMRKRTVSKAKQF